MNSAIISVGSNINPKKNILKSSEIFQKDFPFFDKSKFIKTKAIGSDGPDFLNGAFYIKTKFNKTILEKYLKSIEKKLGRKRTNDKNSPRTIDLDIIIFNNKLVSDDFYKYFFVRESVLELVSKNKLDIFKSVKGLKL